jgi:hypothetical protein
MQKKAVIIGVIFVIIGAIVFFMGIGDATNGGNALKINGIFLLTFGAFVSIVGATRPERGKKI